MITVSVIVPNYNHGPFLRQRLDSIFNQTYQDFEVILLDDASTDSSLILLNEYATHPKVSYFIINDKNSGSPFKQWKKGIELAKGEYIWIAESDDWADISFLDAMVPLFDRDPALGIIFCKSNWVDQNGMVREDLSLYHEDFKRDGLVELKTGLAFHNTIQNASSAILRKKVINLADFPSSFKSCGDWILYTQMLCKNKIQFHSQALNYFRWYHQNTSNAALNTNEWINEGLFIHPIISAYSKFFTLRELRAILFSWFQKIDRLNLQERKEGVKLLKSYGMNYYFIACEYWIRKLIGYPDRLLGKVLRRT